MPQLFSSISLQIRDTFTTKYLIITRATPRNTQFLTLSWLRLHVHGHCHRLLHPILSLALLQLPWLLLLLPLHDLLTAAAAAHLAAAAAATAACPAATDHPATSAAPIPTAKAAAPPPTAVAPAAAAPALAAAQAPRPRGQPVAQQGLVTAFARRSRCAQTQHRTASRRGPVHATHPRWSTSFTTVEHISLNTQHHAHQTQHMLNHTTHAQLTSLKRLRPCSTVSERMQGVRPASTEQQWMQNCRRKKDAPVVDCMRVMWIYLQNCIIVRQGVLIPAQLGKAIRPASARVVYVCMFVCLVSEVCLVHHQCACNSTQMLIYEVRKKRTDSKVITIHSVSETTLTSKAHYEKTRSSSFLWLAYATASNEAWWHIVAHADCIT